MKSRLLLTSSIAVFICAALTVMHFRFCSDANESDIYIEGEQYSNSFKRNLWILKRLVDPETGLLPLNIHLLELAHLKTMPKDHELKSGVSFNWNPRGPYKVGGRTRAMAMDVSNDNVLIAGGVSGGLWRTNDGGQSWQRVLAYDQHPGITCVVQDTRPGKQHIWYAGSGGEPWGNSASKGLFINLTANYLGTGVYKSLDSGKTWMIIDTTSSNTPQTLDAWDRIWNIAVSPRNDSDIVIVATTGIIFRSNDGGSTWHTVLDNSLIRSMFCEVAVTPTGIFYLTMSTYTTGWNETGAQNAGIWRSVDGLTWTNILPPSLPAAGMHRRTVIAINPSNENEIYFLSNTPESGQMSNIFFGETEWNSLWKYTYLGGDGAGANGVWLDLSQNLPVFSVPFDNFNTQGSYDMCIAFKPDESNVMFIGGTNLYRSLDAFTTATQTVQIGGYAPGSELPFYQLYPGQHPDQHKVLFLVSDTKVMIAATDGGIYKTRNCMDATVEWDSLNYGYITSQFYTIAIDHGPDNNDVIIGGLQDNGSRWTNSGSFIAEWTFPSEGDGSFCAVEDGGGYYYFSRQQGKVVKVQLDAAGNRIAFKRIDPIGGRNYIWMAPFLLDPNDNNIMYLAAGYDVWRNNTLSSIVLDNTWDSISDGWSVIGSLPPSDTTYNYITALSCSRANPAHRIYFASNNDFASRKIIRIDSAHTNTPMDTVFPINVNGAGKYVSCIAVDPRDGNKILVVFSNYNSYSLIYSINGGATWQKVAGNLESPQPPGPPPGLGLGTGPSLRWASIVPLDNGKTVYLVGTSIGLFAADTLMDELSSNDSTIWVQQGTEVIGNAVVEMLDYRLSDRYVGVATHGNGIYSARLVLSLTSVSSNVTCYGYPDGSATVSVVGGELPYTYQWDSAAQYQATSTATGLRAGSYSCTVTDNSGKSMTQSFLLTAPPQITVLKEITNASLPSNSNGAVNISVTGGIPPLTFAWSNGETTEDLKDLPAGIYSVTVTDSIQCPVTLTVKVLPETGYGLQVFPNPNGVNANIRFYIDSKDRVSWDIFSSNGNIIGSANVGDLSQGQHSYSLDLKALGLEQGVYYVRLKVGDDEEIRKIIVTRTAGG